MNFSGDVTFENAVFDNIVINEKDPILKVPNVPLTGLGLSYRDIANQLKEVKQLMLSYPLTQQYIQNPTGMTFESVVQLDRLWDRIGNKIVNDMTGVPQGYGKRLSICRNDGNLIMDVSTYIPNTKWMNFSLVELNTFKNFKSIDNPNEPQFNTNINSNSITFNCENLNISNLTQNVDSQYTSFMVIKCGSNTPPKTDPTDLEPESTTPTTFLQTQPLTTRKEIIQAINSGYGWACRYSQTNFTPNFYVATTFDAADEFVLFIRLSYFVIN
jgi:hypothetical protein